MKTFLLLMSQDGGCDYSIGCGLNWEYYEGESIKDVIPVALKDYGRDFGAQHERGLTELTLIEVSQAVDLGPLALEFKKELAKEAEKKQAKAKEKEERAEFARLQDKYGEKK